MTENRTPILTVACHEPEGVVNRSIYPVVWTPEKLLQFWEKAKQFPTLFGIEIYASADVFLDMFFQRTQQGDVTQWTTDQLFYEVDDMVGIFRIDDIRYPFDAGVHYSFFDRRHKGRIPLIRAMLRWCFDHYGFHRLSTQVPNYVKEYIRHFVLDIGFAYEGKKRKAIEYKGTKYDVNLYGILPSDLAFKERQDGISTA